MSKDGTKNAPGVLKRLRDAEKCILGTYQLKSIYKSALSISVCMISAEEQFTGLYASL